MKEPEMRQIARWIADVIARNGDPTHADRIRGSVRELCQQFPAPGEFQGTDK
jgi:glycine hydroxymethyltransferase